MMVSGRWNYGMKPPTRPRIKASSIRLITKNLLRPTRKGSRTKGRRMRRNYVIVAIIISRVQDMYQMEWG
jgi:hypothetical protein